MTRAFVSLVWSDGSRPNPGLATVIVTVAAAAGPVLIGFCSGRLRPQPSFQGVQVISSSSPGRYRTVPASVTARHSFRTWPRRPSRRYGNQRIGNFDSELQVANLNALAKKESLQVVQDSKVPPLLSLQTRPTVRVTVRTARPLGHAASGGPAAAAAGDSDLVPAQ